MLPLRHKVSNKFCGKLAWPIHGIGYGTILASVYTKQNTSSLITMYNVRSEKREKGSVIVERETGSYVERLTCKGTLRQVFICLRPPPLLGFCLWLG
jgi:hypothetical protein